MRILITGAGQIGRTLAGRAEERGVEAVVLRRSSAAVPGAVRTVAGDAADSAVVRREIRHVDAVVHCVHAGYDPRAWRRSLPGPERVVMDAAADRDVPVLFPESVYAFGASALDLEEGAAVDPCTPLGQVRAELLSARRRHPARTVSLVAGDLIGAAATPGGSIPTATVIRPVSRGLPAMVWGDPDAAHSFTVLDDLAEALLFAAAHVAALAPTGDAVLHTPSPEPISMRRLADLTARQAGRRRPSLRRLPAWPLAVAGLAVPTAASLFRQRYLWGSPMILHPGTLTTRAGLTPTRWGDVRLAGEDDR